MSTVFKDDEGKLVWEHHETFTPTVGGKFEHDSTTYKIKSVTLKVVDFEDGPMSFKQLKSFVELG